MELTASIVLYKTNPSELRTIYDCFLKSQIDFHLYLIDNSPDDRLKNILEEDHVSYYFIGKNLGYGKGHNLVLKKITQSSDYHLILNSDITFTPDVIPELISFMNKNEDVGLVSPKMFSTKGELQYTAKLLPSPFNLLSRFILPSSFLKKYKSRNQLAFTIYDKIMEAPFLSGCFMFLRTKTVNDIGYFDERFFLYTEDIDFSRRINEKYKTIFYPELSIIHKHAKASFKSPRMMFIHIINAIKYFNKWGWVFDSKRRKTNKRILKELNYKGKF